MAVSFRDVLLKGHLAFLLLLFGMLFMTGCSSTWVDDEGNFRRVFGFDKPSGVQVLHSYYWKAPKWRGNVYRYYIAERGLFKSMDDANNGKVCDDEPRTK